MRGTSLEISPVVLVWPADVVVVVAPTLPKRDIGKGAPKSFVKLSQAYGTGPGSRQERSENRYASTQSATAPLTGLKGEERGRDEGGGFKGGMGHLKEFAMLLTSETLEDARDVLPSSGRKVGSHRPARHGLSVAGSPPAALGLMYHDVKSHIL